MCVIVYRPPKAELSEDTIRKCWLANQDGAGFMFNDGETLTVRKGFMKLEKLLRALRTVPKEVDLVVHFRIGTSGKVNPANTHPFPITTDKELLSAKVSNPLAAIAHNGILDTSWCNPSDLKVNSDTFLFVQDILSLTSPKAWDKLMTLTAETNTSRFILMTPLKTYFYGQWHKHEGLWFSNLNWQWSRWEGYGKNYYPLATEKCRLCGTELPKGAFYYCGACTTALGQTAQCKVCKEPLKTAYQIYVGMCPVHYHQEWTKEPNNCEVCGVASWHKSGYCINHRKCSECGNMLDKQVELDAQMCLKCMFGAEADVDACHTCQGIFAREDLTNGVCMDCLALQEAGEI